MLYFPSFPKAWLALFPSTSVGETVSNLDYINRQPLCEYVSKQSEQNQLTRLSSTSTLSITLVGEALPPDVRDTLLAAPPCIA